MIQRRTLLVGWIALLAACGWLLVEMGHGALAPPSSPSLAVLRAWISSRDPATVVMCIGRLVTLLLDGYLLATTLAGAAARMARSASAVRWIDLLAPVSVRRVLAASMGGLALSAPLGVPTHAIATWQAAAAAAGPPLLSTAPRTIVLAPVATGPPLVRVGAGTSEGRQPSTAAPPAKAPSTAAPSTTAPSTTAPSTAAPSTAAPSTAAPSTAAPPAAALSTASPSSAAPPRDTSGTGAATAGGARSTRPDVLTPASPSTWVVRRGQSLWVIARLALEARRGRRVTASEVAPFWASVVAANRARLHDPNLIYEGEVVVIPFG